MSEKSYLAGGCPGEERLVYRKNVLPMAATTDRRVKAVGAYGGTLFRLPFKVSVRHISMRFARGDASEVGDYLALHLPCHANLVLSMD
jgi:hypothetical protein